MLRNDVACAQREVAEDEAVALKIELKPNERVLLGDCVVTNTGPRTRLRIEGQVRILREKDIMTLSRADSLAKLIYLAIQFIYTAKNPKEHHDLYFRLSNQFLKAAPGAKAIVEEINNLILTGELYKALKETRKLIAYEKEHLKMRHAVNAYAKATVETASPRALEANLLLQAAAKLQAVHDSWSDKPRGLDDALLYNRRLWTVFLDAVTSEGNRLPEETRENIRRLGVYVMAETFSMMTQPKPQHLKSMIKINRGLAAGLREKN
ncbi:MAG TPA: flagellar biosynthesis regulator FlaF [Xanthobacteraceae bacterium]|nr:flagellar biosynthesis regulator FlaF [Xanthobacteraceae bacterium]